MNKVTTFVVATALTALGSMLAMASSLAQTQTAPADANSVVVPPPVAPAAPAGDANAPAGRPPAAPDGFDSAAVSRLAEVRDRELRRQADALEALARGLRLYLTVGPELAADSLATAAAHDDVHALTLALPTPLDKLAAECRAAAAGASHAQGRPCYKCGGTGQASCPRCAASGRLICPTCSGLGVIRGKDENGRTVVTGLCKECGSTGVVPCELCGGDGLIECPACKGRAAFGAAASLAPGDVLEFRKAVCKARWLRAGGVDLYTAGARQTSPK